MAEMYEKFVFIFFIQIVQHLCLVCSESDCLNTKQLIILTVASKNFGRVMFYAADEESGSIR